MDLCLWTNQRESPLLSGLWLPGRQNELRPQPQPVVCFLQLPADIYCPNNRLVWYSKYWKVTRVTIFTKWWSKNGQILIISPENDWQCSYCTYLNDPIVTSCNLCGHDKTKETNKAGGTSSTGTGGTETASKDVGKWLGDNIYTSIHYKEIPVLLNYEFHKVYTCYCQLFCHSLFIPSNDHLENYF